MDDTYHRLNEETRHNGVPPWKSLDGEEPVVFVALLSLDNIARLGALRTAISPSPGAVAMARQHPLLTSYIAAANLECRPNRRFLPSLRGRLMHNCLRVSPAVLQPLPPVPNRRNKNKRENNRFALSRKFTDSDLIKTNTTINNAKNVGDPGSSPGKNISNEQAIQLASMSARTHSPVLEELLEEVLLKSEEQIVRRHLNKNLLRSPSQSDTTKVSSNSSFLSNDSSIFPQRPVLARRASSIRTSVSLKAQPLLRSWSCILSKRSKNHWNQTLSANSLPFHEKLDKTDLSDSSESSLSFENELSIRNDSSSKSTPLEAHGDNQFPNLEKSSTRSILKKCDQTKIFGSVLNNNNSINNNTIGSGDIQTSREFIFEQKIEHPRRSGREKKVQWNPNAEVLYYADSRLTVLRRASVPLREVSIPSAERYRNNLCLDLHVPCSF